MSAGDGAPTLACVWVPALATADEAACQALGWALGHLSPTIELDAEHKGRLWLDLCGLHALFAPTEASAEPCAHILPWAEALEAALAQHGYEAVVVLGYRRWSLWALCHRAMAATVRLCWGVHDCHKQTTPPTWCADDERRAALEVPLGVLPLHEATHERARQLRLQSLGELLALRTTSVAQRLGTELLAWRTAMTASEAPLRPLKQPAPPRAALALEPPTQQHEVVLFAAKRLLAQLRAQTAARHVKMAALIVELVLEGPGKLVGKPPPQTIERRLNLAHIFVTEKALLGLLRLYITGLALPAAVAEVVLRAEVAAPQHEQQTLWATKKTRNLERVNEALAQLRAALGERAVVVATLVPAHIPEAAFAWQPAAPLSPQTNKRPSRRKPIAPSPQDATGFAGGFAPRPLVRRLFAQPKRLGEAKLGPKVLPALSAIVPWGQAANTDAACQAELAALLGPTPRVQGPFVLSGRWWNSSYDSDEYYVRDTTGVWQLVAFDRHARRWWWRGYVD